MISNKNVAKYSVKHKIVKGDEVKIIAGDDKGNVGKVLSVHKKNNRVYLIVEGCKMVTKHVKPTSKTSGGLVRTESLIDISNVLLYDSSMQKASRIGYKFVDGVKKKFFKCSGKIID